MELGNRLQAQLDVMALAVYLGTNHDSETGEDELKINKQHQDDKATLVKLLAAKVSDGSGPGQLEAQLAESAGHCQRRPGRQGRNCSQLHRAVEVDQS